MAAEKIREQVEFYFSDANYARDRFMQDVAKKNEGCIPVETLLTFSRLKRLGATKDAVLAAVENSQVVAVEKGALKKIVTDAYIQYCKDTELDKRIVCMSGFPLTMTLEDIKGMLGCYCKPVRISMQRNSSKKFSGVCLVEFSSVAEADEVLKKEIPLAKEDSASKDEDGDVEENGERKRLKAEVKTIKITSKEQYAKEKKRTDEAEKEKKFAEKVKRDFLEKLWRYDTSDSWTIAEIKQVIKNAAFVDEKKKVIRMKFQDPSEKENENFELGDKKLQITKMSAEEAQEYVDKIEIKRVPKTKK